MNDEVAKCFQTIIEEREASKVEKMVDGYSGFLSWTKTECRW